MSTQENFDALFNVNVDMGEQNAGSKEDYQASADKGKNGVYQSIIKFIPWWQNPKNSIQEKWVSWLVDPVTQKGRFVDCPSSVGKPSLLSDMYWKLKKSESVNDQKKADVFSRRHGFASLIQIIKDEQQPELEGKILVYRYGKKIWEKINAEKKPLLGDPTEPFDLLKGKAFHLVITKVSGFNNYDQSRFLDKIVPMVMKDASGKLQMINASTDKAVVFNFLKENSPDLGKHGFKEWDQETYDYVNHVITAVTGQAAASNNFGKVNEATHNANPTGPASVNFQSAPQQPTKSGITSSNISLDDLNTGSIGAGISMPSINLPDLPEAGNILGNLDDVLGTL
jgi:hypothetical protein